MGFSRMFKINAILALAQKGREREIENIQPKENIALNKY
jgi:hypothetical protein